MLFVCGRPAKGSGRHRLITVTTGGALLLLLLLLGTRVEVGGQEIKWGQIYFLRELTQQLFVCEKQIRPLLLLRGQEVRWEAWPNGLALFWRVCTLRSSH
jgi:hypothetical protein